MPHAAAGSLLRGRTLVAADEKKGTHILSKTQNHNLSSIQWLNTKLVLWDNTLWYIKRWRQRKGMVTRTMSFSVQGTEKEEGNNKPL